MNNDSIVRECVQVCGENTNLFKAKDEKASVTNVFKPEGPRFPRSSLASVQLVKARTREELRQMAQKAWRQSGLALIDPLLIEDDFARQALINEANRLYGRRAVAEMLGEVQS